MRTATLSMALALGALVNPAIAQVGDSTGR
jgi:hypothetical protein